jgi:hypothetical protein
MENNDLHLRLAERRDPLPLVRLGSMVPFSGL